MNWIERARREIGDDLQRPTAVTAKRNLRAAMAVPHYAEEEESRSSIDSIGSTFPADFIESAAVREKFEERAAIMEFEGGLSRDKASRTAWNLTAKQHGLY